MTQAQRLKRVFGVEINCAGCGGKLNVIANIEEPEAIGKILAASGEHRDGPASSRAAARRVKTGQRLPKMATPRQAIPARIAGQGVWHPGDRLSRVGPRGESAGRSVLRRPGCIGRGQRCQARQIGEPLPAAGAAMPPGRE